MREFESELIAYDGLNPSNWAKSRIYDNEFTLFSSNGGQKAECLAKTKAVKLKTLCEPARQGTDYESNTTLILRGLTRSDISLAITRMIST